MSTSRYFAAANDNAEQILPEVIAERCVHSHLQQASCTACVDICPRCAWVIDDEMLGIDSSRCDGCGLCAPVCPEQAIQSVYKPSVQETTKGSFALAICDRVAESCREQGWVPCLNSIGVRDLLLMSQRGIDAVLVTSGDCETCSRAVRPAFTERVKQVNRLLKSHARNRLSFTELVPSRWRRLRQQLSSIKPSRKFGRRAFFTSLRDCATDHLAAATLGEDDHQLAPKCLLPDGGGAAGSDVLHLYVPVISVDRCSGCDACTRVCPHNALTLSADDSHYRINAAHCTGCSMCVDLCILGAVRIAKMARSIQPSIPLFERCCSACGVPFHTPAPLKELSLRGSVSTRSSVGLCTICSQRNHHENLYQVLES